MADRAGCNRLQDVLDDGDVMVMVRCGRPEDHPMHDPLGPAGCHVYDSGPLLSGERTIYESDASPRAASPLPATDETTTREGRP